MQRFFTAWWISHIRNTNRKPASRLTAYNKITLHTFRLALYVPLSAACRNCLSNIDRCRFWFDRQLAPSDSWLANFGIAQLPKSPLSLWKQFWYITWKCFLLSAKTLSMRFHSFVFLYIFFVYTYIKHMRILSRQLIKQF